MVFKRSCALEVAMDFGVDGFIFSRYSRRTDGSEDVYRLGRGSLLHEPVGFGVSLERWNCS